MTVKRRNAYIALTVLALIWGIAFPIIKPALAFITPLQYLYLRFLVAGLVGFPLMVYFYIKEHPKASYTLKVVLVELLQILALPLLYLGLSKTSALQASLIGSLSPVFVVLGGVWFLHERESKREWKGLALALAGSLLLAVAPLLEGSRESAASAVGNLYVMAYNILYTVYVLVAKKAYKSHPPLHFGPLIYLETSLVYGYLLLFHKSLPSLSTLTSHLETLIAVLYMALPGTLIAFALYLYAQSKIEVSEANLFTYLNGVIAIPAAYLLLGEIPTAITVLAIGIITLGVWISERR